MRRDIDRIILAAACILPFLRLGIGEIQPWDESLYTIRANACLKFGAWLDQTKYAVGHLYSATHPPLGVWLIAFSKFFFGDSTFAVRLPAAIAASASVFLFWLIIRHFASRRAALIASVSLATADLFLGLSHRAQMETLILFFGLASIQALLKSIQEDRWILSIISGIFLGFGLMTKFGVAIFAAPFLLLLPWVLHKPRSSWKCVVSIVVAVLVAAPWFIMMLSRHSDYLSHVTSSLITLSEGNYAPSKLAWWYYLNRLVVGLPLIVIAFLVRRPSRLFWASLVWLFVLFAGLQFAGTRMPHFAFLLLAPGAMLIGSAWDNMKYEVRSMKNEKGKTISSFTFHISYFIFLLLIIGYSASEQVRLLLTGRLLWRDFTILSGGVAAFAITVILGIVAMKFVEAKGRASVGFSALLLAIAFAHIFSIEEKVYENGAEQVAKIAESIPGKSRIVIIHPDFPNEEYAPQLAYYTDGWTLGWLPGKTSNTITYDTAATSDYVPDTARDVAIITRFEDRFYQPSDREIRIWGTLNAKLRKSFSYERTYRSYILFY